MDKFTNLLKKIKAITAKIDTQIETKNMNIDTCNENIMLTEEELNQITATLSALEEKRSIMQEVMDEDNILVCIIRKAFQKLLAYEKEIKDQKEWSYLILFNLVSGLAVFSIPFIALASPLLGLIILAGIAVGCTITFKDDYILIRNLKREYTPATLENEINQKKKDKLEKEKKIARLRNKKLLIKGFVDGLHAEKEYYKSEYIKIQQERARVYNEQVAPLLNAAYNSFDTSDIEARIRAREKRNNKQ